MMYAPGEEPMRAAMNYDRDHVKPIVHSGLWRLRHYHFILRDGKSIFPPPLNEHPVFGYE